MEDGESCGMKQEPSSEKPTSFSDLHESLLHQILALLDVYDIPSCAQVCKKWHLIISTSPSFARLHALLHREPTWFTTPSRNSMAVYDMATGKSLSMGCLQSADDTPDALDTATGMSSSMGCLQSADDTSDSMAVASNSEKIELFRGFFQSEISTNEEPLATAEGLVLSRSKHGGFTITNIVTRKKRPLLSPDPPIHHLAFVGMAYSWPSMSYQILLCGLERTQEKKKRKRAIRLITSVYNSLIRGWTNAPSSLSAEFFKPEIDTRNLKDDEFSKPRNCVWFDGRFYCSMGRALHFFDLASMEWGDLFSPQLRRSCLDQPCDGMQVWLPEELTHFFCMWEHKGELLLAGSSDKNESKIVTEMWRLVPTPFKKRAANDSITFQWKHIVSIPVVDLEADAWTLTLTEFQGKQLYDQGGTICLSIVHKDMFWEYFKKCQVQFYVYDLVKESFKRVKSILITHVMGDVCMPANLAIQPCPFTSP